MLAGLVDKWLLGSREAVNLAAAVAGDGNLADRGKMCRALKCVCYEKKVQVYLLLPLLHI